jgi:hypothetical protein
MLWKRRRRGGGEKGNRRFNWVLKIKRKEEIEELTRYLSAPRKP